MPRPSGMVARCPRSPAPDAARASLWPTEQTATRARPAALRGCSRPARTVGCGSTCVPARRIGPARNAATNTAARRWERSSPSPTSSPSSVRPSNRHGTCARQEVHGRAHPRAPAADPSSPGHDRDRRDRRGGRDRVRTCRPRWVTRRPRRRLPRRPPTPSLTTTQALCLHLRDLQTLREDALTRLADTVKADAVDDQGRGGLGAHRGRPPFAQGDPRLSRRACDARRYERRRRRAGDRARRDAVLIGPR